MCVCVYIFNGDRNFVCVSVIVTVSVFVYICNGDSKCVCVYIFNGDRNFVCVYL